MDESRISSNKRERQEYDEIDSAAVKRLKEDLLDGADDDYGEFEASTEDLDTFIKKFQEEITASPSAAAVAEVDFLDFDSFLREANFGYLLDDDLGIPAARNSSADAESEREPAAEREPSESGFGPFDGSYVNGNGNGNDRMFEYSDLGLGSVEYPVRPETLSAQ